MQVVVGRIGRAHGIRGEVSIDLRTDEPERRFAPGSTVVLSEGRDDASRPLRVASARPHSGRLLVRFVEIADRGAAEALRGSTLSIDVDEAELPEDPEEFYDHQLVGLDVRVAGRESPVGVVREVLHLPGQDMITVATGEGAEVMVPFVADLVPTVDVGAGHLVVADRPGLLDPTVADVDDEGPRTC